MSTAEKPIIADVRRRRLKSYHRRELLSSRHLATLVITITLALLGAVIFFAHFQLRRSVRDQISLRDAKALYALWMGEQLSDWEPDLGPVTDATDYLMPLLEANKLHKFSQIPSVKATRLFDIRGKVVMPLPEVLPDAQIKAADLAVLATLQPVSHFVPAAHASDLSILADARRSRETFPLLDILVPLHAPGETQLLGAVQFLLDGTSIAEEFRALDQRLLIQAAAAFFAVGGILTFVLGWAFHQLQATNALLVERTQSLLQANQELVLAAKTSAVGAVTAHLIHGLKNPLSGLQHFMAERTSGRAETEDKDWDAALSSAKRMQALINETVRVLREQDGLAEYELSLEEIADLISSRLSAHARQRAGDLRVTVSGDAQFKNRDANLVVLILENLLHNAIQATPPGGAVTLDINKTGESVVCQVRDQGAGVPETVRNTLFQPCQSTKPGGSGLGLAISKQLASSVGATLELSSSSSAGCVFTLTVPLALCSSDSTVSAAADQTCLL